MNDRELRSKLEQGLEGLYDRVRKTTDEKEAIKIGCNIKYHQIAYKRLVGCHYIPKRSHDVR